MVCVVEVLVTRTGFRARVDLAHRCLQPERAKVVRSILFCCCAFVIPGRSESWSSPCKPASLIMKSMKVSALGGVGWEVRGEKKEEKKQKKRRHETRRAESKFSFFSLVHKPHFFNSPSSIQSISHRLDHSPVSIKCVLLFVSFEIFKPSIPL